MALIDFTAEQIVELIRDLPEREQKRVFELLQPERDRWWAGLQSGGERHMRTIASARGVDWDDLDEGGKESFIDDLLHGDA